MSYCSLLTIDTGGIYCFLPKTR
jgi:hypothetical protein